MKRHFPIVFVLLASVIMLAGCVLENINGRFWLDDFKVYYEASHAMLGGGQVYGVAFSLGSGYYKYSPFTALLVTPLAMLPYKAACMIQYIILAVSVITMLIITFHIADKYVFDGKLNHSNWLLTLAFLCFIIHLVRELHLGNINLILLMLLTLSLRLILKKRFIWAGLLFALVIISKPFFILLLLPLVLHKQFKTILAFIGSMAIFAILPAMVVGFSKNIELHKEWLNTMIGHADAFPSNNTFDALIRQYVFHSAPDVLQYVLLFAICAAYVVVFYIMKREKTVQTRTKDFILEWFLLIGIMPTIFRTDTQHFLLSAPLILIMLYYLFRSKTIIAMILFALCIILYDCNSTDLLGGKLSESVNNWGLLGISNILIITMLVISYFKKIRPTLSDTKAH